MGQGSAGYFGDDEDETDDALPMHAEDRASTNLRDPDFQLPAEEPEPVSIPEPQVVGAATVPEAPRPRVHQALANERAEERLQHREQGIELQQQRNHQRALRDAGVVGTSPDGAPVFKPETGKAQQAEDGRWVREMRDSTGRITQFDMESPELTPSMRMRVDPATGDKYFDEGGIRTVTGRDEPTVQRLGILAERKRLRAENAQDLAQLSVERDALQQAKLKLKAFGATPTQYETQLRNLEPAIKGKAEDSPEAKRYREIALAWEDWQRSNPEYRRARAEFDAYETNVTSREQAVQDRRLRAAALLGNGAKAAIAGSVGDVGPLPIIRGGDADPKSLAAWATLKGIESGAPPLAAHYAAVQALADRGIKSIGGRPVSDVLSELQAEAEAETAPIPQPTEKSFGANMVNAGKRGWLQFQLSEAVDSNDSQAVAGIMQQLAKMPESDASARWSKGDYNVEALPEMFVSSMAAYLPAWITRLPKYAGGGAAIGAGVGAAGFGAGALPGAITGASIGALRGATGAASLALESSGKIVEALSDRGVDVTSPEALAAAFSNPELMDEVRMLGLKKGLPVAIVDSLTAGIGSRFFKPGQTVASRIGSALGAAALEGAAGAGGEYLGQKSAGEKIDVPSIAAEGAVEFMGLGETALSLAAQKAKLWLGKKTPTTQAHAADSYAQIGAELDDALAKANTARDAGDLTAHAERLAEVENLLGGAHEVATATVRLVPDAARKAIVKAADPSADFEAQQEILDSDPGAFFATAEIGQALRDVYQPSPEILSRAVQATGAEPALAETIADQHIAFAAARDLQSVLDGKRIAPEREQALANLGLLEIDAQPDGTTAIAVADDALPLLPRTTREALRSNPDTYGSRFMVTPGASGDVWSTLVSAGRQRIGSAISRLSPAPAPATATLTPSQGAGGELDAVLPEESPKNGITTAGLTATDRASLDTWLGKYGRLFDHLEWRNQAKGSGGVGVSADGRALYIFEPDLAATLAAVPAERRAAKLAAMLDEELRHVADIRVNDDASTAALWEALPDPIKQATESIYTRDRVGDAIASGMGAVQWGREFKRLISQQTQTGRPSELMEITLAEIERAAAAGDSTSWVGKLLTHLRKMMAWLQGSGATEAMRQLRSLHDELERINRGGTVSREAVVSTPAERGAPAAPGAGGVEPQALAAEMRGPAVDQSTPDNTSVAANGDGEDTEGSADFDPDGAGSEDRALSDRDDIRAALDAGLIGAGSIRATPAVLARPLRTFVETDIDLGGDPTVQDAVDAGLLSIGPDDVLEVELSASQLAAMEAEAQAAEAQEVHDAAMEEAGYLPLHQAIARKGGISSTASKTGRNWGSELRRVRIAIDAFNNRQKKASTGKGVFPSDLFRRDGLSPDNLAHEHFGGRFADGNDLLAALENELASGKTHWVNPDEGGDESYGREAGYVGASAPAGMRSIESIAERHAAVVHARRERAAKIRKVEVPAASPVVAAYVQGVRDHLAELVEVGGTNPQTFNFPTWRPIYRPDYRTNESEYWNALETFFQRVHEIRDVQEPQLFASRARRRDTGTLQLDLEGLQTAPRRAQNLAKVWQHLTRKRLEGQTLTQAEENAYRVAERELGQKYLFEDRTVESTVPAQPDPVAASARRTPMENQRGLFTGRPEDRDGNPLLFSSGVDPDPNEEQSPNREPAQEQTKPADDSGGDEASTFESAAADIRAGAEAIRRLRGATGGDDGRIELEALYRWAGRNKRLIAFPRLETPHDRRGDEHRVWFDHATNRVEKATHPDTFGQGFIPTGPDATPAEYFERLALQIRVFGDDIKLVGVTARDGHLSVITSQPMIVGAHPSIAEVESFMRSFSLGDTEEERAKPENQFQLINLMGLPVWYRKADNVGVSDAHTGNFIKDGNDNIFPIDLVMKKPEGALKRVVEEAILRGPGPDPRYPPPGSNSFASSPVNTGGNWAQQQILPMSMTQGGNATAIDVTERTRAHRIAAIAWESAGDVFERSQNPVAQSLSKKLRDYTDTKSAVTGVLEARFERILAGEKAADLKKAKREFKDYFAARENSQSALAASLRSSMSPLGKKLVSTWEKVAVDTGKKAQALNIQVWDAGLNNGAGGYRLIGNLGTEYFPRMMRQEVWDVIDDPDSNPKLRAQLEAALVANGWDPAKARAFFELDAPKLFDRNDFFAALEMARKVQLPEEFYEYDFDKVVPGYIDRFAQRSSQILHFGQKLAQLPPTDPRNSDFFDKAHKEAANGATRDYIEATRKQVYGVKERGIGWKGLSNLRVLASGLLLSNPFGTVPRNVISGLFSTSEQLGAGRSLAALKNILKGTVPKIDAVNLGIIRGAMLDAAQYVDPELDVSGIVRKVSGTMLKYSGYNASEQFLRWHAAATAMVYVNDFINAAPNSAIAKEAEAFMGRIGINPAQVRAEAGDFKQGMETRKFLRQAVKETQFGYDIDQVPLWGNSPLGRLFYQFGRWGMQRTRALWKHVFEPAIFGQWKNVNGRRYRVRDYNGLARLMTTLPLRVASVAGGAALTGEMFAGLAAMFFDRDRDDSSLEEIAKAWDRSKVKATAKAAERAMNDIMISGMLGILGQPLDFYRAWFQGSRFKNPLEPPVSAIPRSLGEFALSLKERGAPINLDDFQAGIASDAGSAVGNMIPGARAAVNSASNLASKLGLHTRGIQVAEAERQVRNLRKAATRFAKENGLEAGRGIAIERTPKKPYSATYDRIQDALLIGDFVTAQRAADEYLDTIPVDQRPKMRRSLKLSVKQREPIRVGPFRSAEVKTSFLEWARQNLSPVQVREIEDLQRTYEQSAAMAGF